MFALKDKLDVAAKIMACAAAAAAVVAALFVICLALFASLVLAPSPTSEVPSA